jgi:outer membrane receptor protein involved in Fe transport
LAFCGAATVAHAQDGDAASEEVVVTAQRREQALADVPQPVQALSETALRNAGVTNLIDTVQLIPSASVPAQISAGTEVYQIRSVSAGQAIGDSTVGFYLDEFGFSIPSYPFAPSTNLYDVQRVEVLRGPSGTLYGQGSLGGTIKVLSNPVDLDVFEGSVAASASGSSIGTPSASGDAMVNIPVVEGEFAIRAVVGASHRGGYVDIPALGMKDANDSTTISGRVKAMWQPTERLRIGASYWRNETEQGFTNRMDSFDPPAANDKGYGESPLEYSLYTFDVTYDFDFATLMAASGYLDQTSSLVAIGDQVGFGNYVITSATGVKSFNQEVRLTSNSEGPLNWIVGAFYRDAEVHLDQDFLLADLPLQAIQDNTTNSKSWAIYGEVSYGFLDESLIATIGGRYFEEKRDLEQNSSTTIGGAPPILGTATVEGDSSTFNPRFNLAYHVNDDGMVYAEIAKGFRSGAVQGEAAVASLAAFGVDAQISLGADTLWNYEIGTKWRLFDRALTFELALYYFDWSDAQLQFSPAGLSAIIQAGDVVGKGVDLTLIYRTPLDGLTFQFAGNYNSTETENTQPAVAATLPWLADGNQLPGSPRHSAALIADYRVPYGDTGFEVFFNARYQYRDHQRDIVSGKHSAVMHTGSLRMGFGNDEFDVTLFCDNITDERGPSDINSNRFVTPYPREIGVSVNARF